MLSRGSVRASERLGLCSGCPDGGIKVCLLLSAVPRHLGNARGRDWDNIRNCKILGPSPSPAESGRLVTASDHRSVADFPITFLQNSVAGTTTTRRVKTDRRPQLQSRVTRPIFARWPQFSPGGPDVRGQAVSGQTRAAGRPPPRTPRTKAISSGRRTRQSRPEKSIHAPPRQPRKQHRQPDNERIFLPRIRGYGLQQVIEEGHGRRAANRRSRARPTDRSIRHRSNLLDIVSRAAVYRVVLPPTRATRGHRARPDGPARRNDLA